MSDFSIVGDFDQYTTTEKYKNEQDAKFYKWIKILVFALLAVFLLELVIFKIIHPSLSNPKIVVTGNKNYTDSIIIDSIKTSFTKNWFDFDAVEAASLVSSISGIESVDIKKVFPDKIKINVKERESVAMIFINKENQTLPIQIDKKGVLFENINNKIVEDGSIPIISGIPVEHLETGMRIAPKYRVLIDQIAQIKSVSDKYFAGISEICVVPKTYGNYELVLIPANSKVKVLISRFLSVEVLDCMLVVLDVVDSLDPNVTEIDLRYNSVSFKTATTNNDLGGQDLD